MRIPSTPQYKKIETLANTHSIAIVYKWSVQLISSTLALLVMFFAPPVIAAEPVDKVNIFVQWNGNSYRFMEYEHFDKSRIQLNRTGMFGGYVAPPATPPSHMVINVEFLSCAAFRTSLRDFVERADAGKTGWTADLYPPSPEGDGFRAIISDDFTGVSLLLFKSRIFDASTITTEYDKCVAYKDDGRFNATPRFNFLVRAKEGSGEKFYDVYLDGIYFSYSHGKMSSRLLNAFMWDLLLP